MRLVSITGMNIKLLGSWVGAERLSTVNEEMGPIIVNLQVVMSSDEKAKHK